MSEQTRKSICIIGSGNWGSVVARLIGANVPNMSQMNPTVYMYVFEETINGRKLTEIINELHENVKYLPGIKLPANVVATSSLVEACEGSDILVFVLPHQFLRSTCCTLKGRIKPTAVGLSLIKGFHRKQGGGIELISNIISKRLKIPCYVMMGANLASEIAMERASESTIGCEDPELGKLLKLIIEHPHFRITVIGDRETVEICGALKNVVACAAGFIDGLDLGENTKAAAIRLGLLEMIKFTKLMYPSSSMATFMESCGIADIITSCYGGRNHKACEAFVKTGKEIAEIEAVMLNGQKLQGPSTAEATYIDLKSTNTEDQFPIFTVVHRIFAKEVPPDEIIKCLMYHPIYTTQTKP